jgi:hypothetical protein
LPVRSWPKAAEGMRIQVSKVKVKQRRARMNSPR